MVMKWDSAGLIPAIIQDARSGAVRMLGWMSAESLERTRETGHVWFWSRSRQTLWKKGETSGNTLDVIEIRDDCDHDALLIRVTPHGPTCHTGTSSCFSSVLFTNNTSHDENDENDENDDGPKGAREHELERLEATLVERRAADPGSSYTASLLASGPDKINAKIREESGELIDALANEADERVTSEAADVIYHLLVGLVARDIPLQSVWDELERRSGTSGLVEKASRTR